MLVAIFFIILCLNFLGIFIKYAVNYFVGIWDENTIWLELLRKDFGEFQLELQNLSAKDEFAKYARVQRKVNKTRSEISNIVAEKKHRVAKFLYPLKILTYILNVSSTIALLVMYRNILCGDIPIPWLSPFDAIMSFPLSTPGKISVPVWIFMCRTVSCMVMTCLGAWFLYLRFFVIWLLVITMDFLLEFRFEFLWPLWLLMRTIYDSFKYQGLGLTVLFLVVTLCADLLCFVVLPVHWLFFAASTYVWVHFVWNTDRGPCLPTLSLWLLFVYVEASVRLRGIKSIPFHLDLCRPFAAHCIGYPMVSLGYGFKSYVGCRIKQYKQEDVSKENDFYHQLISYALPSDLRQKPSEKVQVGRISEDGLSLLNRKTAPTPVLTNGINTKMDIEALLAREASRRGLKLADLKADIEEKSLSLSDLELIPSIPAKTLSIEAPQRKVLYNGDIENGGVKLSAGRSHGRANGDSKKSNSKARNDIEEDDNSDSGDSTASSGVLRSSTSSSPKSARDKTVEASLQAKLRDEMQVRRRFESQISQYESDLKRVRFELHSSRQQETELRGQLSTIHASERFLKSELSRLRLENEGISQKITSLTNTSKQDKLNISSLEKKYKTERESRQNLEQQLRESKKKSHDITNQRENHDACVAKRQELEKELVSMRENMSKYESQISNLENENEKLKKKSMDNDGLKLKKETELLYSALTAMQGKNTHLENSLSSETRIKLDLFSALGDTRRQLEILQSQLKDKEKELETFKGKFAEAMAVMPQNFADSSLTGFLNPDQTHAESAMVKTSSYLPTTSSYVSLTKNGIM